MHFSRARTIAIASAVTASLALAGCATSDGTGEGSATGDGTGEGSDAQETCEISFLTALTPSLSESFWEEQVGIILEEELPNLKVDIQYSPGLDRRAYASQLLAAGTLPDLLWEVPTAEFVRAGAILPYDEADVKKTGIADEAAMFDGKFYTLPVGSRPKPLIYYNKDIFKANGLSVPSTFAELVDVAAKLKSAGVTPFLAGGGSDPWTSALLLSTIIQTDVYAENANWMQDRKEGQVSFTDPLFKSAVQKWNDLVKKGYFNSDALSLSYTQLIAKFVNGEGAMYPMGSWASVTVADFDIGLFALPNDAGKTIIGNAPTQMLSVSSESKCTDQVKAFAVALATSEEFATAFFLSDGLISFIPGWEAPTGITQLLKDTVDVTQGDVTLVDVWAELSGPNAAPTGFMNEFDKGAQEVISGGSVDDFLANMDKVFDDLNTAGQ